MRAPASGTWQSLEVMTVTPSPKTVPTQLVATGEAGTTGKGTMTSGVDGRTVGAAGDGAVTVLCAVELEIESVQLRYPGEVLQVNRSTVPEARDICAVFMA